jgi:serine/threonine protein kinase
VANKLMNQYEVRGRIGQGGMANVFLGYDLNLEREVAIKVLETYFARESAFAARFELEAKVVTSLEHSYIVPVYDYGHFKGLPYLVMRYMRGGSLRDRLANGAMTVEQVNPVLQRIASALDYAHAKRIIHRDLKPDNILFDIEGNAFLADFGIVKMAESSTTFTQTGNTLGTPAYMSPEQAKAVVEVDYRSDIYSLGVVLYEMLTGDVPYKADTNLGQAMMHVLEPVPRILEVNPDLPYYCEEIISKALAKERNDRYTTVGKLADALSKAIQPVEAKAKERVVVDSNVVPPRDKDINLTQNLPFNGKLYHLEMNPSKLKGKGVVRFSIYNDGNQTNTYTVTGHDADGEIQFDIPQRHLRVVAGEIASINIEIAPRKRPLLARSKTIPFHIYATLSSGDPQFESGKLQIQSIIPLWLFPLLIVLLLAGSVFTFWPPSNESDRDRDGIVNDEEIALGTDPDNPDSDGDGFTDGYETQHGTNPLDNHDPNQSLVLPSTHTPTSSPTPTHSSSSTPSHTPTKTQPFTPTPTNEPTSIPTATSLPRPRMWNAAFCSSYCLDDGSNVVYSLPERSSEVFIRWNYENVPFGAEYTRSWTSNEEPWVIYSCAWDGPTTGVERIHLWDTEVGLRSGEWKVKVTVNGEILLEESIFVQGNYNEFIPVSPLVLNRCK